MVNDKHLGMALFCLQLQSQLLLNGGKRTGEAVVIIDAFAAPFRLQIIRVPSQRQIVFPGDSCLIEHWTICNIALQEYCKIGYRRVSCGQPTRRIADCGQSIRRPGALGQSWAALCRHDFVHRQVSRFMVSRQVEAICQKILHHPLEFVCRWLGLRLWIANQIEFLRLQPLGSACNFLLLKSVGELEQINNRCIGSREAIALILHRSRFIGTAWFDRCDLKPGSCFGAVRRPGSGNLAKRRNRQHANREKSKHHLVQTGNTLHCAMLSASLTYAERLVGDSEVMTISEQIHAQTHQCPPRREGIGTAL